MGNRSKRQRRSVPPSPLVEPAEPDPGPPVMWPSAGSGFEPSIFSPAGTEQALWRFTRGLRSWKDRSAREDPRRGLFTRLRAWFNGY